MNISGQEIIKECMNSESIEKVLDLVKSKDQISLYNILNNVYINLKDENYELNNFNCLLASCMANNLTLLKWMFKITNIYTESIVSLNGYEEWDYLTFSKLEPNIYSFLNNKYEEIFHFKSTVLWHICRCSRVNNLEIIKFLVNNGAESNTKVEPILNSTPLM